MDYLYTRDYTHEGNPWGLSQAPMADDEASPEASTTCNDLLAFLPPEYYEDDPLSPLGEDWEQLW